MKVVYFTALVILLSFSDSYLGDITPGEYYGTFSAPEIAKLKSKRIRREIRDLSKEEWFRVAAAINIMKNTSQTEGKAKYGSKFENYDVLCCQHYKATFHPNGDLGHVGPHFFTWHRIFLFKFEESLKSIDSSIESLPYWDTKIDETLYGSNLTNSPLFSNDYFGSLTGDKNNKYIVSDGQFPYWPIANDTSKLGCEPELYSNPYGLLRYQLNPLDTKYVTRMGGSFCDDFNKLAFVDKWDVCLNISSYVDFRDCQDNNFHALAHWVVAGTKKLYENQTALPGFGLCTSWQIFASKLTGGSQIFGLRNNCFDCPFQSINNITASKCQIGIDNIRDCALCKKNDNCTVNGTIINIPGTAEQQYIVGDFFDVATSVNDPIFMFHHANMDRFLSIWQVKYYNQKNLYYNYPTTGLIKGVNLNDVMSDTFPFINLFNGIANKSNGPYTNKDVLDALSILESPYTYDSIIALVTTNITDMVTTTTNITNMVTTTTTGTSNTSNSIIYHLYFCFLILFLFF